MCSDELNCVRCIYSRYDGFAHSDKPWICGLDNQPIKELEGVCPMFEESDIHQMINSYNGYSQDRDTIDEPTGVDTIPGLIQDFPKDVEDWIASHPPKEQGIKYDDTKPRLAEMIQDFALPLEALCRVWEFGADKYGKSNWKFLAGGEERYLNALLRHITAIEQGELDDESGLPHASHIAFNSLAYLHYVLQRRNNGNK